MIKKVTPKVRNYYINYFYKLFSQIADIKEYIYCRFIYKTHIIKIDTKYRLMDCSWRMFYACFEILNHYVEKDLGKKSEPRYKGYRVFTRTDCEAIDLYLWYKNEYKNEQDITIVRNKFDDLMKIRTRCGNYIR